MSNWFALLFKLKPGTEGEVAEIFRESGRPEHDVKDDDGNTVGRLLTTLVFVGTETCVRIVEVEGDVPVVARHMARQAEVREVEEGLDPHLAEPRDMTSPEGAQEYFRKAAMFNVLHRRAPAYLRFPLEDFLQEVASSELNPGSGFVAGVSVSMAAGLVAMAARVSRDEWPEADDVAERGEELRQQVAELAELNAEAYAEAIAAQRESGGGSGSRDAAAQQAVARAADPPFEIGKVAAEVADLAARVTENGLPSVRADAAIAASLARTGAVGTQMLIEINAGITDADERLTKAREIVVAATEAEERAVAAVPEVQHR
jgi:formiminotetrahydrofolate cyclodeaminase